MKAVRYNLSVALVLLFVVGVVSGGRSTLRIANSNKPDTLHIVPKQNRIVGVGGHIQIDSTGNNQPIDLYTSATFNLTEKHTDTLIVNNSKFSNFTLTNYEIKKKLEMNGIDVEKPFLMEGCVVKSERVGFYRARFGDECSFLNTKFVNCKFIDFREARFVRGANFDFVDLPDTLDFTRATVINEQLNLIKANMRDEKKKCVIFLEDADISKIIFNYKYFRLGFSDTCPLIKKAYVYEMLMKRFKENFQIDDFETLSIEYRDEKAEEGNYFAKAINVVEKYWWCYGFRKEFIFYWTIGLLALFVALSYFVDELSLDKLKENYDVNRDLFNESSKNRLISTVFYIGIVFIGIKLDVKLFKKELNPQIYFIFLVFVAGLICVSFIASIILAVK